MYLCRHMCAVVLYTCMNAYGFYVHTYVVVSYTFVRRLMHVCLYVYECGLVCGLMCIQTTIHVWTHVHPYTCICMFEHKQQCIYVYAKCVLICSTCT